MSERKYNIYEDGKGKVIVVSYYEGRCVRGIAKCSPADEYNAAIGVTLAQTRCDAKIAVLKKKKRIKELENADAVFHKAREEYLKKKQHVDNAIKECEEADNLVQRFLDDLSMNV